MSEIKKEYCPVCGKKKEKQYIPFGNICVYKKCQCEIDKEAEERKKDIKTGRNRLYFELVKRCGLTGLQKNFTFSSFLAEAKTEKAEKEKCIDFADKKCGNLIIIGNVGTGKTHLASAIINQICYNTVRDIDDERILDFMKNDKLPCALPAYYIRECDLTDCFKKVNCFGNNEAQTDKLNLCKKAGILCIDDVGVKNTYTDNDLSMLYDIIDTRYNKNLSTIITSNLKPEEIKNTVGERCYDRIKCGGQIVVIAGASHRKARE